MQRNRNQKLTGFWKILNDFKKKALHILEFQEQLMIDTFFDQINSIWENWINR